MPKNGPASPSQLNLLDALAARTAEPGADMAWGQRMQALMSKAIMRSELSRQQIADGLSCLLRERISIHQMNSWLADSKASHRFPAEYLPAFCAVTGDLDLVRDAAQLVGARIASREDLVHAELGRIYRRRRETSRKESALLKILEGGEQQ